MDDRPKSVRHAQPELLIRMLALLHRKNNQDLEQSFGTVQTYPFEVSMDYVVGMKSLEPVTDVEGRDGLM